MKRCATATLILALAGPPLAAPPAGASSPAGDSAGERHLVRHAPGAEASFGRHARRRSLASFAHITDLHIADEASPARHEQLYGRLPMFAGFWRPQEAFGPHVADGTVQAVNRHAARLGFALVTGDLADNAQVNEVRWAVRALDGGRLDPFSGRRISASNPCDAPAPVRSRLNHSVAQRRYRGVSRSRRALRSWPGALARAQRPFTAEGLALPWYSVRGNHDALAQGHYRPGVTRPGSISTGCRKVLGRRGRHAHPWQTLRRALPSASFVSPDPRRRFVRSAAEFRRLHGRADRRHGFGLTPAGERRRSRGMALYYAWSPRPGLRFVALDTTADAGGAGGNLDHPQYVWLKRELGRARRRKQLVVVYAHHPLEMMDNPTHDEQAGRYDRDPRASHPLHLGRNGPASLRGLLLRHPNVVLYLAGHKHYDRVWPNFRRDGRGFWQVITGSLAGAPQQARLIDLMDNDDGSLSIFATMVGHASPTGSLAAISRTLAWKRRPGERPVPAAVSPMRNVELVVRDPR